LRSLDPPRTTPRATPAAVPLRQPIRGAGFAAKRTQHAVELFGACMMIAFFLSLALFA